MNFYMIDRIIVGDTLFGLFIWLACVIAYVLAACARWLSGCDCGILWRRRLG
jgi:hypothetical protein